MYTERKFSVQPDELEKLEDPKKLKEFKEKIATANEMVVGSSQENLKPKELSAEEISTVAEGLRDYHTAVEGYAKNKNHPDIDTETRTKLQDELEKIKVMCLKEGGFNDKMLEGNPADTEAMKIAKQKLNTAVEYIRNIN